MTTNAFARLARAVAQPASVATLICLLTLHGPAIAGGDRGKDDKKSKQSSTAVTVALELPSAPSLGRYRGETRVRVGHVRETGYNDRQDDLGSIRSRRDVLVFKTDGARADVARDALEASLAAVGLAPTEEGSPLIDLDVTVVRNQISSYAFGLRAEVFLDVIVQRGDNVLGRVLACGNAERRGKFDGEDLPAFGAELYRSAFNDALYKLLGSETFDAALGTGWSAGEPEPDPPGITRIDRANAYGPTAAAVQALPAVQRALEPRASSRVVIEDFAVRDLHYLTKKGGTREAAARRISRRVAEHLWAYYPGAFDNVQLREGWDKKNERGLVVTGSTLVFDPGGNSNRLQADVYLKDGTTGVNLFTIHVDWRKTLKASASDHDASEELPCGTLWKDYYGTSDVAQMEETLAANVAFLVLHGLLPDYVYPKSIEVRFDDLPSPFLLADRE